MTTLTPKIQHCYAETKSGQVHYLLSGELAKPVLVLLHQAPSSSEMYRQMMPHLTDKYCCIAPDFIGHGLSESIELEQHSIEVYAQSVVAVLETLNITNIALFGHHTGAAVAKEVASKWPSLCQKVILSGPTLMPSELCEKLPAMVALPALDESGDVIKHIWQKMRSKDTTVPLALTLRECSTALQLGEHYQATYKAVAQYDAATSLKNITCPTLVFAGDRDVLQPYVDDALALLSNGKKAEIGDCSTYVCETHAKQVANLISKFIE